jgi:hypothetical protein
MNRIYLQRNSKGFRCKQVLMNIHHFNFFSESWVPLPSLFVSHSTVRIVVCMSISIYLSVCLSVCPCVCLSVCLSIYLCIYSCCSHLEHRASVKWFLSLQFLNLRQSVELLGWGISPTQGRYLHKTTQT